MDEFVIRLVSDDFAEGAKTERKAGGVGTGVSIGAGFALAQEGIKIISDAMSSVFRPVKTMLTNILRMVAEFTRPIMEVVLVLLKPVLSLLKPILTVFRTMLAPFLQIARQFSAISQQQMAKGDIAGAMGTALEAATTIIGPFVVALVSVGLQLASTLIIGALTALLAAVVGVFSDKGAAAVTQAGDALIGVVNGNLQTATDAILSHMQSDAMKRLTDLQATLNPSLDNIIEAPRSTFELLSNNTAAQMTTLNTDTNATLTNMGLTVTKYMDPTTGTIVTDFRTALDKMADAAWDFHGKLVDVADEIRRIRLSAGSGGSKVNVNILGIQVGQQ